MPFSPSVCGNKRPCMCRAAMPHPKKHRMKNKTIHPKQSNDLLASNPIPDPATEAWLQKSRLGYNLARRLWEHGEITRPGNSVRNTDHGDAPAVTIVQLQGLRPRGGALEKEPKLLLPISFTLAEASQVTGLSKRTLRRLVKRGLLRPSRASQRFIFSRIELERFLKATSL